MRVSVIKTDEKYREIIKRLKRENATLKKENKTLTSEQLIKGTTSRMRAEAYKEGYDTCRAQMDLEKEELKLQIAYYEFNVNRFLNLEVPVSETYKRFKEGI